MWKSFPSFPKFCLTAETSGADICHCHYIHMLQFGTVVAPATKLGLSKFSDSRSSENLLNVVVLRKIQSGNALAGQGKRPF